MSFVFRKSNYFYILRNEREYVRFVLIEVHLIHLSKCAIIEHSIFIHWTLSTDRKELMSFSFIRIFKSTLASEWAIAFYSSFPHSSDNFYICILMRIVHLRAQHLIHTYILLSRFIYKFILLFLSFFFLSLYSFIILSSLQSKTRKKEKREACHLRCRLVEKTKRIYI